ncbi:MAG: hypothetical protein ACPHIA_07205 [Alphaproteobacteria bacterium]
MAAEEETHRPNRCRPCALPYEEAEMSIKTLPKILSVLAIVLLMALTIWTGGW